MIQTAALVGYPPARDLLARNYPQSETLHSAPPRLAEHARAPVLLEARRRRRPGMEVDGAVGIFQQVYARGAVCDLLFVLDGVRVFTS